MKSVTQELRDFVTETGPMSNYFSRSHEEFNELKHKLDRFLASTMDEVRLDSAGECTRKILKVADLQDLEMLREGVWKREASGVISYSGQRDHTAHTLNNWLLGWYLYTHSSVVKNNIGDQIRARKWDEEEFDVDTYFGHLWQFTSLLHDVGYLFEGSLSTMDPAVQSTQAMIGARILDDYFQTRLWTETSLGSTNDQRVLFNQLNLEPPQLPNEQPSLARIAFYLRELGDLTDLGEWVDHSMSLTDSKTHSFPADAFDLWEMHFKLFNQPEAAKRIRHVESAFHHYVNYGQPGLGIRILDHAVCSGLTLLKIATFFYTMMAKMEHYTGSEEPANTIVKRVRERTVEYNYNPKFWWTGIVWATASTAIHNLQQAKGSWCEGVNQEPLKIEEEPLGYLGVLVDCIQEWDRYFVFSTAERLPVQGNDVTLSRDANKVIINLGNLKRAEKIRAELDSALVDWTDIIELLPKKQTCSQPT